MILPSKRQQKLLGAPDNRHIFVSQHEEVTDDSKMAGLSRGLGRDLGLHVCVMAIGKTLS